MDIFGILNLVGGLAMFLFGMSTMGDGLVQLSGGRLEKMLEKLTKNKGLAVLLGLLVAGAMISVDSSDAAVKRNRVRPRTFSKPVTQPAPTATQQTTAAPAAAATAISAV